MGRPKSRARGRTKCTYAHHRQAALLEPYDAREEPRPVLPPHVIRALAVLCRQPCEYRNPAVAKRVLHRLGHLEASAWIEQHERQWQRAVFVGVDLKKSVRGETVLDD